MSLLVATTIDVTIVLTLAFAALACMRRRSAALRHAVLASAVVLAASAPLLEAMLPTWAIASWPAPEAVASEIRFTSSAVVPETSEVVATAAPRAPLHWTELLVALWLAGVAVTLAGLLTALVRLLLVTRTCTNVSAGRWRDIADELTACDALRVAILQSGESTLLVTCGMVRPKIVLPAGAASWPVDRCRAVLAHEIAHIRRRDWLTQLLAETVRALYWFNPLVWLACRRLREESEYACDDAVLGGGVEATTYATHLLEVARDVVGVRAPWAAAPAIAHPSTLERRISAMLTTQRNRSPLTRRSRAVAFAAMALVALPIAASGIGEAQAVATQAEVRNIALAAAPAPAPEPARVAAPAPTPAPAPAPATRPAPAAAAQQKPASISGTLYDQLGGLLPGAQVTLTDQEFGVTFNATTNRNGEFAFTELNPGRYELVARLPGFATVSNVMPIGAGSDLTRRIVMPLGSLEETLNVGCQPGAATTLPPRVLESTAAPAPSAGGAVFSGGIGGQIKAPRALSHAKPICPNAAFTTDTIVRLSARVGIDGFVSDLRQISTPEQPAAEFVASAMEAVRLWHYTPTLLNGVPVEANMTVTVLYKRM